MSRPGATISVSLQFLHHIVQNFGQGDVKTAHPPSHGGRFAVDSPERFPATAHHPPPVAMATPRRGGDRRWRSSNMRRTCPRAGFFRGATRITLPAPRCRRIGRHRLRRRPGLRGRHRGGAATVYPGLRRRKPCRPWIAKVYRAVYSGNRRGDSTPPPARRSSRRGRAAAPFVAAAAERRRPHPPQSGCPMSPWRPARRIVSRLTKSTFSDRNRCLPRNRRSLHSIRFARIQLLRHLFSRSRTAVWRKHRS